MNRMEWGYDRLGNVFGFLEEWSVKKVIRTHRMKNKRDQITHISVRTALDFVGLKRRGKVERRL